MNETKGYKREEIAIEFVWKSIKRTFSRLAESLSLLSRGFSFAEEYDNSYWQDASGKDKK
ncbi:MAG: hypothetical protein ACXQTD_00805 [Candidatus Syntropharchaeia archaeon]